MSEHVYDRFERAVSKMDAAEEKVNELIDRLSQCSAKLAKWKDLQLADNTDQLGYGMRPANRQPSLDVQHYPKIKDIYDAITEWHQARGEALGAVQAGTSDQQAALEARLTAKLR
jgi:multidrug resistance efflux pump